MSINKKTFIISGVVVVVIAGFILLVQGYRSFLGARPPLIAISESIIGGRLLANNFSAGDHTLEFRAKTTNGETVTDTVAFSVAEKKAATPAHIVYVDGHSESRNLRYATNISGHWKTSNIESSTNLGSYSVDLAVDSRGKVHVSYSDRIAGDLKYATNDSGSWVTTTVDSAGFTGEHNSIAVDSNDKVHISYRSVGSSDVLKYATNVSGSWVTTTIDTSSPSGIRNAIAVDRNNKIHISYYDISLDSLKYATNSSGSWKIETVDTDPQALSSSIKIDSQNIAHIAYGYGEEFGPVYYANNASGTWVKTAIPLGRPNTPSATAAVGRVGNFLTLDDQDKVYILYSSPANVALTSQFLVLVTNASGSWSGQSIVNAGKNPAIAYDPEQRKLHISYVKLKNETIYHYAVKIDDFSSHLTSLLNPVSSSTIPISIGTSQ